MTNKLYLILGGVITTLLFAFAGLYLISNRQEAHASFYNGTFIGAATTSSATSVTASTRILATTTNANGNGNSYTRVYAVICNPNSTVVALGFNNDKAVDTRTGGATAFIAAAAGYNACFEVTDRNLYQGSIQASSTVGAVTVTVMDYVQ